MYHTNMSKTSQEVESEIKPSQLNLKNEPSSVDLQIDKKAKQPKSIDRYQGIAPIHPSIEKSVAEAIVTTTPRETLQRIANGTGMKNENNEMSKFDKLQEQYSLSPELDQQQTLEKYLQNHLGFNRNMLPLYFDTRINPVRIYGEGQNAFYAVWKNRKGFIGGEDIGWEKTREQVGNRDVVHKVLDIMAASFKEGADVYPWRNTVPGFSVDGRSRIDSLRMTF